MSESGDLQSNNMFYPSHMPLLLGKQEPGYKFKKTSTATAVQHMHNQLDIGLRETSVTAAWWTSRGPGGAILSAISGLKPALCFGDQQIEFIHLHSAAPSNKISQGGLGGGDMH